MIIKTYRFVTICYKASERKQALVKQKSFERRGYSLEVSEDEISGDPEFPLGVQLLQSRTKDISEGAG